MMTDSTSSFWSRPASSIRQRRTTSAHRRGEGGVRPPHSAAPPLLLTAAPQGQPRSEDENSCLAGAEVSFERGGSRRVPGPLFEQPSLQLFHRLRISWAYIGTVVAYGTVLSDLLQGPRLGPEYHLGIFFASVLILGLAVWLGRQERPSAEALGVADFVLTGVGVGFQVFGCLFFKKSDELMALGSMLVLVPCAIFPTAETNVVRFARRLGILGVWQLAVPVYATRGDLLWISLSTGVLALIMVWSYLIHSLLRLALRAETELTQANKVLVRQLAAQQRNVNQWKELLERAFHGIVELDRGGVASPSSSSVQDDGSTGGSLGGNKASSNSWVVRSGNAKFFALFQGACRPDQAFAEAFVDWDQHRLDSILQEAVSSAANKRKPNRSDEDDDDDDAATKDVAQELLMTGMILTARPRGAGVEFDCELVAVPPLEEEPPSHSSAESGEGSEEEEGSGLLESFSSGSSSSEGPPRDEDHQRRVSLLLGVRLVGELRVLSDNRSNNDDQWEGAAYDNEIYSSNSGAPPQDWNKNQRTGDHSGGVGPGFNFSDVSSFSARSNSVPEDAEVNFGVPECWNGNNAGGDDAGDEDHRPRSGSRGEPPRQRKSLRKRCKARGISLQTCFGALRKEIEYVLGEDSSSDQHDEQLVQSCEEFLEQVAHQLPLVGSSSSRYQQQLTTMTTSSSPEEASTRVGGPGRSSSKDGKRSSISLSERVVAALDLLENLVEEERRRTQEKGPPGSDAGGNGAQRMRHMAWEVLEVLTNLLGIPARYGL